MKNITVLSIIPAKEKRKRPMLSREQRKRMKSWVES